MKLPIPIPVLEGEPRVRRAVPVRQATPIPDPNPSLHIDTLP